MSFLINNKQFEKEINYKVHSETVSCVCFSPDETILVSVGHDGIIVLFDISKKAKITEFTNHLGQILCCDHSPTSDLIVTGSDDDAIRFWRSKFGEVRESGAVGCEEIISNTPDIVNCIRFHSGGKNVLTGNDDETIINWNIERKKRVSDLHIARGGVVGVDIHPDDRTVLSGHDNECVVLWDLRIRKYVHTFEYHTGYVNSVKFHPTNSDLFVSGSNDGTTKLCDFRNFKLIQNHMLHDSFGVTDVSFHPSGKYVASASADNTIKILGLLENCVLHTLKEHTNWVSSVKFSSSGNYLASGGWDDQVILWKCKFYDKERLHQSKLDLEERTNYLKENYVGMYVKIGINERIIPIFSKFLMDQI